MVVAGNERARVLDISCEQATCSGHIPAIFSFFCLLYL